MKTIAEAAGWERDFDALVERFQYYKRSAALLDFDDLIFAARNLLRDHDEVRRALGARFTRVLVDEFQDTDPLQTEIFWRLCGEPPAGRATAGVADVIGRGPDGTPHVVIDWKSDVQPTPETVDHYRAQVRAYLDMTGAARGLIVLVTTGEIIAVTPSPLAAVAA